MTDLVVYMAVLTPLFLAIVWCVFGVRSWLRQRDAVRHNGLPPAWIQRRADRERWS